jgi:GTP pyrophosphokinase
MVEYVSPDGSELFNLIATFLSPEEQDFVRKGYEYAREEHGDVRRKSGEPYITHPLTIAYYLAEYGLDAATLVAALLHDVAEDTPTSIPDIRDMFGHEVAQLVDGLTKFEAAADVVGQNGEPGLTRQEQQNATLHKLFGYMVNDIRVGIIKIFDRLHNMRTIEVMSPESQERNARETLAVYAPLANRLGLWGVKNELQMISLAIMDKAAFQAISRQLQQLIYQQQADYSRISNELSAYLTGQGVQVMDIFPYPRNIYSIYKDAQPNGHKQHFSIDSILRLVVVLKNPSTCYLALGYTHQLWRPVPQMIDDYIAAPRDNLYKSLHTTVMYRRQQRLKVRFRTVTMNTLSEIGVLAKWLSVGNPLWSPEIDRDEIEAHMQGVIAGIRENINLDPQNPELAVQGVVEDVFRAQIVVFTPMGDAKQLPAEATPLDFAYTIHTEVGAQCRAAIVNGQPYPLNKALRDGDVVHIQKRGNAPQRVWLDENLGFLTTNRARSQARRWFKRILEEAALKEGRQILNAELQMLGLGHRPHEEIADLFGFAEVELLYHALGRAELLPTVLATRVLVDLWNKGPLRSVGTPVRSEDGEMFVISSAGERELRLCRTCTPRPGDIILGFVRADKGVTVHREGCHTIPNDPFTHRMMKLNWGEEGSRKVRLVTVEIDVFDRAGLMFEITELIQGEGMNMSEVYAKTSSGDAIIRLMLEAASPRQLVRVLHRIQALVNVYAVRCIDMV